MKIETDESPSLDIVRGVEADELAAQADIASSRGEFPQAEVLYYQVAALRECVGGSRSKLVRMTYERLAEICEKNGHHFEALRARQRACFASV